MNKFIENPFSKFIEAALFYFLELTTKHIYLYKYQHISIFSAYSAFSWTDISALNNY